MSISNLATGLRPGVCTSTTRPTSPYTGMVIYETDTGYLRVWDGSAWDYLSQKQDDTVGLGATQGLIKIVPSAISSVSGTAATIASDGTVNIGSGNSSVTVTAFTSTFANYRIMCYGGGGAGAGALRISLGSGSTSGHYTIMTYQAYGSNTVSGTFRDNQTYFEWAGTATTAGLQMVFELRSPYLSTNTYGTSFFTDATNTGTAHHRFNATTSFTQFTLGCDTNVGTFSGGSLVVYGYHN